MTMDLDAADAVGAKAAEAVEGRILKSPTPVPSMEVWDWVHEEVRNATRRAQMDSRTYTLAHRCAAIRLRSSERVQQGANGKPFSRGGWRRHT